MLSQAVNFTGYRLIWRTLEDQDEEVFGEMESWLAMATA